MKFFKLFKVYNNLSAKEKKFLKTSEMTDKRTVKKWLEFINKMLDFRWLHFDSLDELKALKIILFSLAGVIFVINIIVKHYTLVFLPLAIISFFLAIFVLIKREEIKGNMKITTCFDCILEDLANTLFALKEDIGEDGKIKIKLNTDTSRSLKYFVDIIDLEPLPNEQNVIEKRKIIYLIPHFSGEFMLPNGISFVFTFYEKHIEKEKLKRGEISGRLKRKSKLKFQNIYIVKMLAPSESFQPLEGQAEVRGKGNFYLLKQTKKITYSEKVVRYDPKIFMELMLLTIQQVKPINS